MTTPFENGGSDPMEYHNSMNIKKPVIIFAAILAFLGILVLATLRKDFTPADLQTLMSKRIELSRFCSSSKPDFVIIEKTYDKGPKKVVRWVDDKLGIKMGIKIRDSIASGKSGSIPVINAQIIDLTVSRVLWEYFVYHTENSGDADNIELARIAGRALMPHVEAADQNFMLADQLIYDAKTELASNFQQDKSRQLIKVFQAAFLLDMLHEMNRADENTGQLQVFLFHTARALQFFNILYTEVSRRNMADAVFINGELRKRPAETEMNEIRNRLKTNFANLPYMRADHFNGPVRTGTTTPSE